ncbi:MAG: hypothetical protein HQM06_02845 [Magnetococcales bacterium]|nr:hypothetical protein [Magnetococcales bacterium]
MKQMKVGRLMFHFPQDWVISQYDSWKFYREHFAKQKKSIKGVDLLAIAPDKIAYLIEVTDYNNPTMPAQVPLPVPKPTDLSGEITDKVFSTLAALLPARLHTKTPEEEAQIAVAILGCHALRVIAHIEPNGKFVDELANVKINLRRHLKAIDPQAGVVHMSMMGELPWSVST